MKTEPKKCCIDKGIMVYLIRRIREHILRFFVYPNTFVK